MSQAQLQVGGELLAYFQKRVRHVIDLFCHLDNKSNCLACNDLRTESHVRDEIAIAYYSTAHRRLQVILLESLKSLCRTEAYLVYLQE